MLVELFPFQRKAYKLQIEHGALGVIVRTHTVSCFLQLNRFGKTIII